MQFSDSFVKFKTHVPFLIKKDIPRFIDEKNYAASFGNQWSYFPKTQLDSYTCTTISETRLKRCLGESLWNQLNGCNVLEVGCGAGRFTEILLKNKANVASVDLSNAVETNAENFPVSKNHIIIQADIMSLPFIEKQFDIVVCLGVLQHTPDPALTVSKLSQQVKENGYLVIDQYIFNKSYLSLRLVYRQLFKRLPAKFSLLILKNLSPLFLPLHKKFKHSKILSLVLNRFSPFVTYYTALPELNDELQTEWAMLDTFDTLTDWNKNFGTLKSINHILIEAGFEVKSCTLNGNGIEALARKI